MRRSLTARTACGSTRCTSLSRHRRRVRRSHTPDSGHNRPTCHSIHACERQEASRSVQLRHLPEQATRPYIARHTAPARGSRDLSRKATRRKPMSVRSGKYSWKFRKLSERLEHRATNNASEMKPPRFGRALHVEFEIWVDPPVASPWLVDRSLSVALRSGTFQAAAPDGWKRSTATSNRF